MVSSCTTVMYPEKESDMSFSSEVKEELAKHISPARHCQIAELAALMNFSGQYGRSAEGDFMIGFQTENEAVVRKGFTLLKKTFNIEADILEHITRNDYSTTLNESIFEQSEEDEIILCLNYDGLYGINNINRFLQSCNNHPPIQWGVQIYKVGDPILFNESNRFAPLIYNNLKGRIVRIEKSEDVIQFDIEIIDVSINELDADDFDFELVGISDTGNSIIRFNVNRLKSTDDDDESSDTVVPFQIAYAVSIHKAQGLEYNSVKIVITNEIEELITHNIIYTAITRAKEKLKIYWTPETEKKVLEELTCKSTSKDISLLRSKL